MLTPVDRFDLSAAHVTKGLSMHAFLTSLHHRGMTGRYDFRSHGSGRTQLLYSCSRIVGVHGILSESHEPIKTWHSYMRLDKNYLFSLTWFIPLWAVYMVYSVRFLQSSSGSGLWVSILTKPVKQILWNTLSLSYAVWNHELNRCKGQKKG